MAWVLFVSGTTPAGASKVEHADHSAALAATEQARYAKWEIRGSRRVAGKRVDAKVFCRCCYRSATKLWVARGRAESDLLNLSGGT